MFGSDRRSLPGCNRWTGSRGFQVSASAAVPSRSRVEPILTRNGFACHLLPLSHAKSTNPSRSIRHRLDSGWKLGGGGQRFPRRNILGQYAQPGCVSVELTLQTTHPVVFDASGKPGAMRVWVCVSRPRGMPLTSHAENGPRSRGARVRPVPPGWHPCRVPGEPDRELPARRNGPPHR